MTISLGRRLRDGSSGVPGSSAGRVVGTCFTLHRTGFGEPPCRHDAGGLLPHRFTLTAGVSGEFSPEAVSFLCHFPSAFAAWDFPSVLPCGVRTFLASRSSRGHPACTQIVPRSVFAYPKARYKRTMRRIAVLVTGALGLISVLGASAAPMRRPITQADSGKTFRLGRASTATLRLSTRWLWSTPRPSSRAIVLTPVEYLIDPGFSEWRIDARARGTATVRAYGRPNCDACTLAARRFRITIVVPAS